MCFCVAVFPCIGNKFCNEGERLYIYYTPSLHCPFPFPLAVVVALHNNISRVTNHPYKYQLNIHWQRRIHSIRTLSRMCWMCECVHVYHDSCLCVFVNCFVMFVSFVRKHSWRSYECILIERNGICYKRPIHLHEMLTITGSDTTHLLIHSLIHSFF